MDSRHMSFKDRLAARTSTWERQHQSTQLVSGGQSGVRGQAALWQQKTDQCHQNQEKNPFSAEFKGSGYVQVNKDCDFYGRPPEGSKTELRGIAAGVHISREVVELCEYIQSLGTKQPDGSYGITFGALFEAYTKISNKLVGMLMRARKQGLVKFEGEMLFQRRDDDVVIWLVKTPEALMEDIEQRQEKLREHAAYKH